MTKGRLPPLKLLVDLFFSFAKISLFTVGGGPAMIPLTIDLATKRRSWLSQEEMLDCVTIAQSLPGGVIVNIATYVGKRTGGIAGMLAAVVGVVFPTATLAVVVGLLLGNLGDNIYAAGAVQGAKAAAVALVVSACVKLGGNALKKPLHYALALGALVAILVLHVSAIWTIVAGGLVGWLMSRRGAKKGGEAAGPREEG